MKQHCDTDSCPPGSQKHNALKKITKTVTLIILGGNCIFPCVQSYLPALSAPTFLSGRTSIPPGAPRRSCSSSKNLSHLCIVQTSVKRSPTPLHVLFAENTPTYVKADDIEALRELFASNANTVDGRMGKGDFAKIPVIAELLAGGDLLEEELDDIWGKAPKVSGGSADQIDVDSFVQIYRDIDDLFEDEDAEGVATEDVSTDEDAAEDSLDENDELEQMFKSLMNENAVVDKPTLLAWEELSQLMAEGLISSDEVENLWNECQEDTEDPNFMDLEGFLNFNEALDKLFDFDDIGEVSEEEINSQLEYLFEGADDEASATEEDMDPKELFNVLKNEQNVVSKKELAKWMDLQSMIAEGDLLSSELESMFNSVADESDNLDEKGFLTLYGMIDNLFEEDEEEAESEEPEVTDTAMELKQDLVSFLKEINEDEDVLPCGLESTTEEQREILDICNKLESSSMNLVRAKQGAIEPSDLVGTWELLYTSSSAMKFNKGLSGLGGSFPNGKFAGLTQELKHSKFISDAEYTERIEVTPSTASFDVQVTGDWDLRSSMSLFSGQPSIVLNVLPDRVNYGPTSTRADHWKSLGPMNSLDIAYLDDDLRIMRGNTSLDTVFILRRVD